MRVFRLTKRKYAGELSGKGAAKSNNRWNSKGTEIIYTAESRALAMAEVAVHLTLATLPEDFVMMEIEIPDSVRIAKAEKVNVKEFVWPPQEVTQMMGDQFIHSGKNGVLQVPSVVVKGDFNYLINPHHPDFNKVKIIKITDFPFDERVFGPS